MELFDKKVVIAFYNEKLSIKSDEVLDNLLNAMQESGDLLSFEEKVPNENSSFIKDLAKIIDKKLEKENDIGYRVFEANKKAIIIAKLEVLNIFGIELGNYCDGNF